MASGALPPGHRLVETALAESLAISRGTLRAALRALTHEGLVAQVAYTKWMVPELSPADAWELYTLRGSLEGLAARLVTERQRPDAIASVKDAFDRLESAVAAESHARRVRALAQADRRAQRAERQLARSRHEAMRLRSELAAEQSS